MIIIVDKSNPSEVTVQNVFGYTVPLKSKLPPSRETRLVSLETRLERNEMSLKRDVSRFSQVHWKYQYFTFVNIQTCFVYYRTDLRSRHDFHSHQQCVCTML